MPSRRRVSGSTPLAGLTALTSLLMMSGCASTPPELVAPAVTVAPYSTSSAARPVFAVAPLRNESGVSFADTLRVTDAVAARCAEVRGIACLPVNRTLAAMRAMQITEIRTPQQAQQLAAAVGADGVIVGSVTAYDPYDPPKIGLTLGLYARANSALTPGAPMGLDPAALRTRATEGPAASEFTLQPLSVISEHLDAASHEVLMNVQRYAEGRSRAGSALGWERYIKSMDLYTDFAASFAVYQLMQEERLRLARAGAPERNGAREARRRAAEELAQSRQAAQPMQARSPAQTASATEGSAAGGGAEPSSP
ncbi:hypothetical protein BH11PLA1_BH11PLA1_03060 [soil metagenome]